MHTQQHSMKTHAEKTQENNSRVVENTIQKSSKRAFQIVDNRPEAVAQRQLQTGAHNSPQVTRLGALQKSVPLKTASVTTAPVIQMKKYVRKKNGTVVVAKDNYKLKADEEELDKETYRQHLAKIHGPGKEKKSSAPRVVEASSQQGGKKKKDKAKDSEGELIYRGMSVNNIANLYGKKKAVFTVQHPEGSATPEEHIVDDDMDSPYLSFEARGFEVSAGKYAPKPVDKKNRPVGVKELEGGFLKQEKSYTQESQLEHADKARIGLVAGIRKKKSHLDYSDAEKAKALKDKKAQDLAIADKEVLIRPGKDGVTPEEVPFIAKVKRVPPGYFVRHIKNQTAKKGLGFYNGAYYKVQIDDERSPDFSFDHPPELRRSDSDSDSEMSDVEDMNMDFSDVVEEEQDDLQKEAQGSKQGKQDKPKDKKPAVRSNVDRLASYLDTLIGRANAVQPGRGAPAGPRDLRAMRDEAYALGKDKKESKDDGRKEAPVVKDNPKKEALVSKDAAKKEAPVAKDEPKKEALATKDKPGKEAPAKKKEKQYTDEASWNITDYGAGGDCLFFSLNASRNQKDANALRKEIVRHQRTNGLIAQGLVDVDLPAMLEASPHPAFNYLAVKAQGKQGIPVEAYYSLMSLQGTWGGRSEISAFSVLRNTTVFVIESTGTVTRYTAGQGTNIPVLPGDAFAGGKIVLYKTANHWRRVDSQVQ